LFQSDFVFSGHWPTLLICVFILWAGRGRKGAENPPSMRIYIVRISRKADYRHRTSSR
jgi:hypothetical protein